MQRAYEAHREDGRLPATCEVVFAQAWSPVERSARSASPHGTSLESLRDQLAARRRRGSSP
jgi:hypothetical protein